MKNQNPKIESNLKTNAPSTQPAAVHSDANPEPGTTNPEPTASRPRVGKIARLPHAVREQLNELIEQGYGGEELLQWLNDLEETQKLLKEHFDDKPISKQNLSDWRRGGFAEWRMQRDLVEDVSSLAGHAIDLQAAANRFIADDLVKVFTARYGSLLMRWNGEPSEQFDAQVRLFSRMRRDLLRLQESAHKAALNERQWEQFEQEEEREFRRKLHDQRLAPMRSAMKRAWLTKMYGEKAGNAMADAYDPNAYGQSDQDENDETEEQQEPCEESSDESTDETSTSAEEISDETSDEPEAATAEKSGASQALGEMAQAVAAKGACAEKPLEESRSVKPISEPMDKPHFAPSEVKP